MSKRDFRTPESYVAEGITRAMIPGFLRERGFSEVRDIRKAYGRNESQTILASSPEGTHLTARVRLCWHRATHKTVGHRYSAAQLLPKVEGDDWEGTLSNKVEREQSEGITHFLFVQREAESIIYAALVPLQELLPIWCKQRDTSLRLIEQGRLGRRRRDHARNGSSPTIWLHDDRAPEVGNALWSHRGVKDLAKLDMVSQSLADSASDDTFDDHFYPNWQLGSDAPPRFPILRSGVRRDPKVRTAVLHRAHGSCEREGCGEARDFPGFLDVHHILGAGRGDRVWNCVALCPNCHRAAHAAFDREQINASLLSTAKKLSGDPAESGAARSKLSSQRDG